MPTRREQLIQEIEKELQKRQQQGSERQPAAARATAFGSGVVEGLPVVGPALRRGLERPTAAMRSMVTGQSTEEEMQDLSAARQQHPGFETAGQVAGAIAGVAPMVGAAPAAFGAKAGQHLLSRMGAGAASGGTLGAADTAAREGDVAAGGALGAAVGGAAPAVGGAIGRAARRLKTGKGAPLWREGGKTKEIRQAASALYNSVEETGLVVRGDRFRQTLGELDRIAVEEGLSQTDHPQLNSIIQRHIRGGRETPTQMDVGWEQIDKVRRAIGRLFRSPRDDERRIAGMMQNHLDDWFAGMGPGDVVAGDVQKAATILKSARATSREGFRSDIIDTAVNRARQSEERIGPALRNEFRKIIQNDKLKGHFKPEELEAFDRVASLSKTERVLDEVGNIRSMIAASAGGILTGLATGFAPAATGAGALTGGSAILAARTGTDAMVKRQAAKAGGMVRDMAPQPETAHVPTRQAVQAGTLGAALGLNPGEQDQEELRRFVPR